MTENMLKAELREYIEVNGNTSRNGFYNETSAKKVTKKNFQHAPKTRPPIIYR